MMDSLKNQDQPVEKKEKKTWQTPKLTKINTALETQGLAGAGVEGGGPKDDVHS